MRTLQHLRQLGGPNRALGNGPLSRVANQLVEQHDAEEARRMHAARVRAELSGTGPLFDALQRLAAKAGEDALEQVETPFVLRFEAQRALSEASKANPDDRGLRLAKANLYNLWRQDPYGYLTIGKVAEIRRHFMNEFPKSKVASIIDREFPKIGFQTLPLSKLNRIAATIDSQESYDAAILAHGLNGSSPNLIRARAYIRGLVAMGDEQTTEAAEAGGAAAASRAFQQVAQLEDGSSVKVDFPEPGETPMDEPMLDGPPMGEEPMHDEGSEETVTLPSPITGEDLVLELGVAEPEGGLESEDLGPPMDDPEMDDTGGGPPDIEDADVEGLEFMGQLADFGDENAPMDETMPGLDDDAVAMIEDPSSGEMLEVRLTPIREEDAPIEGGDLSGAESMAPTEAPAELGATAGADSDDNMSKCGKCGQMQKQGEGCNCAGKQAFAVYAVSGGRLAKKPLDQIIASSMAKALRRIASFGVQGEVRAPQGEQGRRALIVLDAAKGDYLYITAEQGSEFNPQINQQQPAQVDVKSGPDAIMNDRPKKQLRPGLKVPHISKGDAKKIAGMTTEFVEQELLSTGEIAHRVPDGRGQFSTWALRLDGENVVIERNGTQARTASLFDLDTAIDDFIVGAAVDLQSRQAAKKDKDDDKDEKKDDDKDDKKDGDDKKERKLPPWLRKKDDKDGDKDKKKASYDVRPFFLLDCDNCGRIDEYVMPAAAIGARCASCHFDMPAESVGARVASVESFDDFLLQADLPLTAGNGDLSLTARRIISAVRGVVPTAAGRIVEGSRLAVELRQVNDRQLNRIRRVLEDQFGLTAEAEGMGRAAQATQMQTPGSAPGGTYVGPPAPQLQVAPVAPAPGAPPAAPGPTAPGVARPPAAQPGVGLQQAEMDQVADPMANFSPMAFTIAYSEGGRSFEASVDAKSADDARRIFQRFNKGAKISSIRQAQLAGPPPAPPPPGGEDPAAPGGDPGAEAAPPPPGMEGSDPLGLDPALGGGASAAPTPEEIEAVSAALVHYRNQGLPVVKALGEFSREYDDILDAKGPPESSVRHMFEGEIVAIAGEIYSQPGLMREVQAQKVFEPKVNTTQGPSVKLPKPNKLLGPDSDASESAANAIVPSGKIKQQHKPQGDFASTDLGEDSDGRDVDFGQGKIKQRHLPTEQSGTSLPSTDLGQDSDTGENGATSRWNGVADNAKNTYRSKPGAGPSTRRPTGR
jgi:hypothetical protein